MQSKQSFSNPSLQAMDFEAEGIISNHLQKLNQISDDIKVLEERLKNFALPFTFYYVLSSYDRRYDGIGCEWVGLYEQFDYKTEFIEQTDSCLVWGKCEDGQYSLSHNIYKTDNEVYKCNDVEKVRNNGIPKLFSSKPLKQTKSHFRVKIEKELVPFYKGIIEALKMKADEDCIFEYSPNYNIPWPYAKVDTRF